MGIIGIVISCHMGMKLERIYKYSNWDDESTSRGKNMEIFCKWGRVLYVDYFIKQIKLSFANVTDEMNDWMTEWMKRMNENEFIHSFIFYQTN